MTYLKTMPNWKGRGKTATHVCEHAHTHTDTHTQLEIINGYGNIAEYKINIQKSLFSMQ